MKFITFIASGIIATGMAYSTYNAANDYGLRTNPLHPNVAAQGDDTSDPGKGDDTSGGIAGKDFYTEQYLHRELKNIVVKSNNEGSLSVLNLTLCGYKRNTDYSLTVVDYSCRPQPNSKNVCYLKDQRTELLTLHEGGSTNGDSTSGDGTN